MKSLSKKKKSSILRKNLPISVSEYAKNKSVGKSTIYTIIKEYDTDNPILQDLIKLAHKNAVKKGKRAVAADNKLREIAQVKA